MYICMWLHGYTDMHARAWKKNHSARTLFKSRTASCYFFLYEGCGFRCNRVTAQFAQKISKLVYVDGISWKSKNGYMVRVTTV